MKPEDRIIDEELMPVAEKRLKLVLEMRKTMRDLRHILARYIADMRDGHISVEQFRQDLEAMVPKEIEEYEIELTRWEKDFAVRILLLEVPAFLQAMILTPANPITLSTILGGTDTIIWTKWNELKRVGRALPVGYIQAPGVSSKPAFKTVK
jgi:hypothetical protein